MEFDAARELVRLGEVRPGGIGILSEKTLHATLKWWLDEDPTHHEQPLPCGSVADIFDGERVTEIQTANFSAFRSKLVRLLEQYPVTVVHPLVRRKWLRWVDPETGETTQPKRSPRTGSFTDAGKELIYILPCLTHPNLTVRLVLLDVEEHRLADGWGNGGKRGSHRAERYPLALADTLTLRCPADYGALVPTGLPTPFTAAQFGKAARLQGRKLSGTLKMLLSLGVLTREKCGNEYRYTMS
ncbi:MAG: hypothetical protein IJO76_00440 [Clostridia bacterium]|nr:hypothetical protein [Clostridia bacterium]